MGGEGKGRREEREWEEEAVEVKARLVVVYLPFFLASFFFLRWGDGEFTASPIKSDTELLFFLFLPVRREARGERPKPDRRVEVSRFSSLSLVSPTFRASLLGAPVMGHM